MTEVNGAGRNLGRRRQCSDVVASYFTSKLLMFRHGKEPHTWEMKPSQQATYLSRRRTPSYRPYRRW